MRIFTQIHVPMKIIKKVKPLFDIITVFWIFCIIYVSLYFKNYFAVYRPRSKKNSSIRTSTYKFITLCIADPPRAILGAYDNGGTRFASWSGSGVGWKSMRNQAESPFTSHSPHRLYPRRDFRDYLFTLRARTDREIQRGSATPPEASNRPRNAHMHNLCEEFRSRSCTLSRSRDIRIPVGGNTNETGDTRWYATSSGFRRVSHTARKRKSTIEVGDVLGNCRGYVHWFACIGEFFGSFEIFWNFTIMLLVLDVYIHIYYMLLVLDWIT